MGISVVVKTYVLTFDESEEILRFGDLPTCGELAVTWFWREMEVTPLSLFSLRLPSLWSLHACFNSLLMIATYNSQQPSIDDMSSSSTTTSNSLYYSLAVFAVGASTGIFLDRYFYSKRRSPAIADPYRFEASIRRYYAKHNEDDNNNNNEPCPLDIHPSNIYHCQQGSYPLFLKDLQNTLPPHISDYILKLCRARGIDKAVRMRREIINYKKALVHYQRRYESAERGLRRMLAVFHRNEFDVVVVDKSGGGSVDKSGGGVVDTTNDDDDDTEAIKRSIRLHQQLSTIRGCLIILRDVRRWTKNICCIPRWGEEYDDDDTSAASIVSSNGRLFVAGDAAIYKVPCDGFALHTAWMGFRATEESFTGRFRELISRKGRWPPYSSGDNDTNNGNNPSCALCGTRVGKAWMAKGNICWKCADEMKCIRNKCPFEKGHPSYLCSHDKACFSCEGKSCWECRIIRGDGVTVNEMLELGMPAVQQRHSHPRQHEGMQSSSSLQEDPNTFRPYTFLFLDFDQTISSTKSGCLPRTDRHGCNPQLLQLLKQSTARDRTKNTPEIHIVTRQNHTRANHILNFLAAFGVLLPDSKLHCLGGTLETKTERIQSIMKLSQGKQNEVLALFLDDSPAEVCREEMRKMENLVSVLFVSNDFSCRASQRD